MAECQHRNIIKAHCADCLSTISAMGLYECNTPAQAFNKQREDAAFTAGEQAERQRIREAVNALGWRSGSITDELLKAIDGGEADGYNQERR